MYNPANMQNNTCDYVCVSVDGFLFTKLEQKKSKTEQNIHQAASEKMPSARLNGKIDAEAKMKFIHVGHKLLACDDGQ